MRLSFFGAAVALAAGSATAQTPAFSPQALTHFEMKVRPLLRANCEACHSATNKSGGLALDSREAVLLGGQSGPAAKAGAPAESLIIQAVEQAGDLKMPMARPKLKAEEIALLREWVTQKLPWTEKKQTQPRNWDHWSFQVPKKETPPAVLAKSWVKNPIDNFVLARLEKEKVKPSAETDRATLLRRVSLDLTGIPPTPEELRTFLADKSPNAYEKRVDALLASPHYGERWGRHWLDAARYADSDGYSFDAPRPMWKYRDWVISALNKDMPFSQFTIEQIAGDLLPNPTTDQLIASGFHRNTPLNFEGGIDFEQYRNEAVADRVATTGSVFMGLTLGCARCHDHKYDPVAQKEFYQLFAYYNSTDEITKESERGEFYKPYIDLPSAKETAAGKLYWDRATELSRAVMARIEELQGLPADAEKPATKDPELVKRISALRGAMSPLGVPGSPEYHWPQPYITRALVMKELSTPRETFIQLGGDFLQRGDRVYPDVPAALSRGKKVGGNRLDLAKWLVDPTNPTTARVTVNRMWQEYFGQGIVETQDDFGLIGTRPTHQGMLDFLAAEFMANGWKQKPIHRMIVTSATYRQASKQRQDLDEVDPYNKLLARQVRLRLDAEIIRDAALASSGLLNPAVGGEPAYPPIPENAMSGAQVKRPWDTDMGENRYRRAVYTFYFRSLLAPSLSLFDAPDGTASCTRRIRSNSPLQSLTLLNDEAFLEFAGALAKRAVKEGGTTDQERMNYAWLLVVGRKPQAAESLRLLQYLADQKQVYTEDSKSAEELLKRPGMMAPAGAGKATIAELAAWTAVGRVLFNLDDFMTRE